MNNSVMIATLYSYQPILAGVMKLGSSELILLADKELTEQHKKSIDEIKSKLSPIVEVSVKSTSVYDIYSTCRTCVDIIDSIPEDKSIILNISAARKTQALGLQYAGYVRHKRIQSIVYVTKEDNTIIDLPRLRFNISNKEKKVLKFLDKSPESKIYEIVDCLNFSRTSTYRILKDLKNYGYVEGDSYKITSAGKIAVL